MSTAQQGGWYQPKGAYAAIADFLNAIWGRGGEVAQGVSLVSDTGGSVLCAGVQRSQHGAGCGCRVAAQQGRWLGVWSYAVERVTPLAY